MPLPGLLHQQLETQGVRTSRGWPGPPPKQLQDSIEGSLPLGLAHPSPSPSSHNCLTGDLEVLTWWYGHLGDNERVFMLSTLYDHVGRSPSLESGKQLRTSWRLCGVTLCRAGFRKVMGVGSSKLVKMTHGIPDRRQRYVHQLHLFPGGAWTIDGPASRDYILEGGFIIPSPTILELGPPQFGPVVHISHNVFLIG